MIPGSFSCFRRELPLPFQQGPGDIPDHIVQKTVSLYIYAHQVIVPEILILLMLRTVPVPCLNRLNDLKLCCPAGLCLSAHQSDIHR
jgi:hypothetical protein